MCFSAARFNVSIWKVSVALHCTEPPLPQEGPSAGASQRAPPRASEVNRGAEMLTGCVRGLYQQLSPAILGVPAAWGWALLLALWPHCTTRGSAESRESRKHPPTAATPLPPCFFPVTASSLLVSPPAAQQTWKRTPLKHTPDTHQSHSPSLLRVLDSPNHAEFLPSFFFLHCSPPSRQPSPRSSLCHATTPRRLLLLLLGLEAAGIALLAPSQGAAAKALSPAAPAPPRLPRAPPGRAHRNSEELGAAAAALHGDPQSCSPA